MTDGKRAWLFTWEGRVRRSEYLVAGLLLVAMKFAIDWSVAAAFGQRWHIWNYVLPSFGAPSAGNGNTGTMYTVLWLIAIPFFWTGMALTIRRLRDTGRSVGWALLFFVPVANLLMFLWLSYAGSSQTLDVPDDADPAADQQSRQGRSTLGVVLATVLGLGLVLLSSQVLMRYAWGLFLGVPFTIGFIASWFQNVGSLRSRRETIWISILTPFLLGFALLGLRYEGVICLLMALPLTFPFSIGGALLARELLSRKPDASTRPTFAAGIGVLPLLMLAEYAANPEPPVLPVTTSITINAPASAVWKNVVAFPELAAPTEMIFRAGIAYPTGATIVGSGPGAVRYCHFTTGDFVEPITTWDENRLLAFDVAAQPQALRELSPWKVTPPHIERNYFRSRHGQFRLVALDESHTLLEGTTWYQNYFWPQAYWREVSDRVVHRIHMRVLEHVKQQTEKGNPLAEKD